MTHPWRCTCPSGSPCTSPCRWRLGLAAGQSEQLADLPAEYLPLAHTEQDFAPADEKVPAAHSLQMPAEWTYVPASHSPHSDEPLGEDSPASQALQDELPSSLE